MACLAIIIFSSLRSFSAMIFLEAKGCSLKARISKEFVLFKGIPS